MNRYVSGLASVLLFCACHAQAQEATRSWNFKVYLDDKPIGYHNFNVREMGARRELHSDARFDVKVLFIKAYLYQHQASEVWTNDCLQSLQSTTNDNGKHLTVTTQPQDKALQVVTTQRRYSLPGCVMSFAYWNPVMLKQTHLLNAQTGEYDQVRIADLGTATLAVRGKPQSSKHYRLTGSKLSIDLWYSNDEATNWLALESTTDGGRRLRYVLN